MSKKNGQYKNIMHKKVDSGDTKFREEIGRIIKVFVIVLVFFGGFYLLTSYLVNKDSSVTVSENKPEKALIQYQEILVGSSFQIQEDEYLVLFYDMTDAVLKSNYTSLLTTYEAKEEHLSIYTANMANSFNQSFVADEANREPSRVEELNIKGATLIRFKLGTVVDYVEGYDNIKLFLE